MADAPLADVRARLNAEVGGRRLGDVPALLADFPEHFGPPNTSGE